MDGGILQRVMNLQPKSPDAIRRVLELTRRDPPAAAELLKRLPLEDQVAVVCAAPADRRAEVLFLTPSPERVVSALPDAELCFTVKGVGLGDAAEILACATPDQLVACVDLDAWMDDVPDRLALNTWLEAFLEASDETLLRAATCLDPEVLVLALKGRVRVELKPNADDWQPPAGGQTLDGQFYLVPIHGGDDLTAVLRMLTALFQNDYWLYFRLLQGVIWELESDTEEWASRWRSGRLEDLGFPPWDEAIRIRAFLRPERLGALEDNTRVLDVEAWRLPVWIPELPVRSDSRHLVFRTVAELGERERQGFFYAFVGLANKVAVANRMPLSDAETTPKAIENAAATTSRGLEFLAAENRVSAKEVLQRASLERLYRVGVTLSLAERDA